MPDKVQYISLVRCNGTYVVDAVVAGTPTPLTTYEHPDGSRHTYPPSKYEIELDDRPRP